MARLDAEELAVALDLAIDVRHRDSDVVDTEHVHARSIGRVRAGFGTSRWVLLSAAMPSEDAPRAVSTRPAVTAGLVILSVVLLGLYLVGWFTDVGPVRERGSDFSASYVAALTLRDHDGAAVYDQSVERAEHAALLPPGTEFDLPFLTPPTTALLVLPLTPLDPGLAFRVFGLLQLAALTAGLWCVTRAAPWNPDVDGPARFAVAAVAAALPATFVLLLLGQWDGVGALGIGAGYWAWRRGYAAWAAVLLTAPLLATKPHLAVGIGAFLLGRLVLREILAAAATAAVIAGIWVLTVGAAGVSAFLTGLGQTLSHTPPASTVGLLGLLASWLGSGTPVTVAAIGLGSLLLLGCVWLGYRTRRGACLEWALAGSVLLGLAAAPHLLTHDLVLVAPLFVMVVARISERDALPWPGRRTTAALIAWGLLSLVTALDAGNGAPAPPGRLVPVLLLGLGALALRVSRNPRAEPG